jgi:hypothetical protein
MKHIILAWRKYTFLRRNRAEMQEHIEIKRKLNTKVVYLKNWYSVLMRNLPSRLLFEKVSGIVKSSNLRFALTKIAMVAIQRTRMLNQA